MVSMNDGGTDDASNLQCVHPLANRAKGTMGNAQFIEMCKAVADYARHGISNEMRRASKAEIEGVRASVQSEMSKRLHPGPPRELGSSGSF